MSREPDEQTFLKLCRSPFLRDDPLVRVCLVAYCALLAGGVPLAVWLAAGRHYLLAWLALAVPLSFLVELGQGLWRRFESWQRRPRALDRGRLAKLSDEKLVRALEIVRRAPLSGPLDRRLVPHYTPELYKENDALFEELRLIGLLVRDWEAEARGAKERWQAGRGAKEALEWERERRDLKLVSFKAPGRASRPSGLAERLA